MSNLSFKLTPNENKQEEYKSHIVPGVHEVKIVDIVEGTNNNNKDYISITFENLNRTRTHTETMYCSSPKSLEWTSKRITEIFSCLYPSREMPDTLVVQQMKKAFIGQTLRCMFVGEEYERKDKSIGIAVKLRLLNFCESLSIPSNESRFVFDPTKHIKRLEDNIIKKPNAFPKSNTLDVDALDSSMDDLNF